MGNKKRIILSTDDITPENIKKFWRHWEYLKDVVPDLKLNAFVIPYHREEENNNILHPDFIDWYEKRKNWVRLHLHGYTHLFPPEYLLDYDRQKDIITKGAVVLGRVTKNTFGIKPPGYKYNNDTVKICKELCLNFLADEDGFDFFGKPILSSKLPIEIINTHTNGISEDSIEGIKENLKEKLLKEDAEYLFIEDLVR